MSDDIIKVVVDYNLADETDKKNILTGKFKKVYVEGISEMDYLPNKANN